MGTGCRRELQNDCEGCNLQSGCERRGKRPGFTSTGCERAPPLWASYQQAAASQQLAEASNPCDLFEVQNSLDLGASLVVKLAQVDFTYTGLIRLSW